VAVNNTRTFLGLPLRGVGKAAWKYDFAKIVYFPSVISALVGLRQPSGGARRSTFPFDGLTGQSLQGNGEHGL
jgi:hypothetical protein